MKIGNYFVFFCLLAILQFGCLAHSSTANNVERSALRVIPLDAYGANKSQLLILDRNKRNLLSCNIENITDCLLVDIDALDVMTIPSVDSIGETMLVRHSSGASSACKFHSNLKGIVECVPTHLSASFASLVSSPTGYSIMRVGGVNTDCLVAEGGVRCTLVREIAAAPKVIIGYFSSPTRLEAVVFRDETHQLCEVGIQKSCHEIEGLPSQEKFSRAGSAFLKSGLQSTLIFIGSATLTSCTYSGDNLQAKFVCTTQNTNKDALANASAYVLPTKGSTGREVLSFMPSQMRNTKNKSISAAQHTEASNLIEPTPTDSLSAIQRKEVMNERDANSLQIIGKVSSFTQSELASKRGGHTKTLIDQTGGENSEMDVPDYFSWGIVGLGDQWGRWSDLDNIWYDSTFGRRDNETPQQCIARECDTALQDDGQMCTTMTEAVAIPLGVIIVTGAVAAGAYTRSLRVGGAALSMGTSSGSNIVFGVMTACSAWRWAAYASCSRECNK
jgi:hypothetical protein